MPPQSVNHPISSITQKPHTHTLWLEHLPHSIPSSPTATCLISNSIIYRTSLSHWRSSYPFLFALRVISLSFHLSNWSACLFALLLSSNCSLMCHNCKVRQGFYSPRFSVCIFMFWAFCFILITSNGLFSPGHTLPGTSLAQDVLIIQFSFSLYEYLWHDTSLTIFMF